MSKTKFLTLDENGITQKGELSLIVKAAKNYTEHASADWQGLINYGSKTVALLDCTQQGNYHTRKFRYLILRKAYAISKNETVNAEFVRKLKAELEKPLTEGEITEEVFEKTLKFDIEVFRSRNGGYWTRDVFHGSKKVAVTFLKNGKPAYKLLRAAYTTSKVESRNEEFVRQLREKLEKEATEIGE